MLCVPEVSNCIVAIAAECATSSTLTSQKLQHPDLNGISSVLQAITPKVPLASFWRS
jgi:hypothetical protein